MADDPHPPDLEVGFSEPGYVVGQRDRDQLAVGVERRQHQPGSSLRPPSIPSPQSATGPAGRRLRTASVPRYVQDSDTQEPTLRQLLRPG